MGRTFVFTRWSGQETRVIADDVQFTPGGGIAFWISGRLELAVKETDWNNLREEVQES